MNTKKIGIFFSVVAIICVVAVYFLLIEAMKQSMGVIP